MVEYIPTYLIGWFFNSAILPTRRQVSVKEGVDDDDVHGDDGGNVDDNDNDNHA